LGTVRSVLLMTDGCPTTGITTLPGVVEEMKRQLLNTPSCTVHTFGYGNDHSDKMLRAISDEAMGIYYFVEHKDHIPDAFGDCIGGLLSVVGQNVTLSIEGVNGATVLGVHTGFKTEKKEDGSFVVQLGDLQSEEKRDILCKVALPAITEASLTQIVKFNLSYFNVLESRQVDYEHYAIMDRPDAVPESVEVNPIIDQQKNRLLTADVLSRAKQMADANDLVGARDLVTKAKQTINESISGEEPFCKALIADLNECLSGLVDRRQYTTSGTFTMSSKATSHYQQRSTTSTTTYGTQSRSKTRNQFSSADFSTQ